MRKSLTIKEDTHAKEARPTGDKIKAFNVALAMAKKMNKDVVYGYTTKKNPTKFYEIDPVAYDHNDVAFRKKYGANDIYVAYPDKSYINESMNSATIEKVIDDNPDLYCQMVNVDGEDILLFEDWEEITKFEKLLDSTFEPKDKYDTTVLDREHITYDFWEGYAICERCGKALRTEPDSYSDVPDYFISSNGVICGDCVREDPSEYIEDLINNPNKANTVLSEDELESIGFTKLDGSYEAGYYDKNDNPSEILNKLTDKYPYGDFIFSITNQEQFRTEFEVYGMNLEEEENESLNNVIKEHLDKVKSQELSDKIYKTLAKNDVYPDDCSIHNDVLTLVINGDWKHDHLFACSIVTDILDEEHLDYAYQGEEVLNDTEDDFYTSMHTWDLDTKSHSINSDTVYHLEVQ